MLLNGSRADFEVVLNQPKYRYVYLFPVLFGLLLGIINFLNRIILGVEPHFSGLLSSALKEIIIYLIVCHIYSWIVFVISNLFKGFANSRMTFAVVSYSMIPLIIGSFLILVLKIGFYEMGYFGISWMLYFIYLAFLTWTIYVLTIGNSIINKFSFVKSFVASSSLIILYTTIEILALVK